MKKIKRSIETERIDNIFGDLREIYRTETEAGELEVIAEYIGSYDPETEEADKQSAMYCILSVLASAADLDKIGEALTESGEEYRKTDFIEILDETSASHTEQVINTILCAV
jgi:hypothetical protein